jgi:hypothetical protein
MLKALWRNASVLAVMLIASATANAGIDFGIVKLSGLVQSPPGFTPHGVGSVYGYGTARGGPFTSTVQSGSILPTGTPLTTFCLELNQEVSSATYHLVTLDLAPNGGALMPDSDAALGISTNGIHMSNEAIALIQELYGNNYASLNNATANAPNGAFQLDVWTMEYFGKQLQQVFDGIVALGGYTAGNPFTAAQVKAITNNHADLSTNATALSWLNQALGTKIWGSYAVFALINPNSTAPHGTAQDQIVTFDGGPPPLITVPEPASLAVWGMLGLVGIAYGRRRKQA